MQSEVGEEEKKRVYIRDGEVEVEVALLMLTVVFPTVLEILFKRAEV